MTLGASCCFKCKRDHLAVCTGLPKCFPDKGDTPSALCGGLSSPAPKCGVWRAVGRGPKSNKDKNTEYLLFQESLLKAHYRLDVCVTGEWVVTSLKPEQRSVGSRVELERNLVVLTFLPH